MLFGARMYAMLSITPDVNEPPLSSAFHPDLLDRTLRERFGLHEFYPWQREAIEALMNEPGRVLVVAPTGGGKSLCYQLPGALLPGTTVVVSPLIALMEDQVRSLEERGIAATYLASTLPFEERSSRMRAIRAGRMKIVYLAPERLSADGFLDILEQLEIGAVVVDEAHCIVSWGHDFRPDYLRIGEMIERLKPRRIMACTATATASARDEILAQLGLHPKATKLVLRGFARPNLVLDVGEVARPRAAIEATHAALLGALASQTAPRGAAIVYAATRRMTERIATELCKRGWEARAYHAGLSAEERSSVQDAFADKSLGIVVATNAFGMGIDRGDVRLVVHAQPPSSVEAYYQEVGRAGRDGEPARGLMLVSASDIALRRRMCELGPDGGAADPAQAARAWASFRDLLRFIDARSCRHDFLLRYFDDEAESSEGCGRCDVCRHLAASTKAAPEVLAEEALVVRKALSGVARGRRRSGMQAIAEMLRGDKTARVVKFGFDELSTFGLLASHDEAHVMAILRALLAAGYIDLTPGDYPLAYLTELGAKVMRAEEPVRMRLPPQRPSLGGSTRRSKRGRGQSLAEEETLPVDPTLLEALRVYRSTTANEASVPPYVVAHDRTLNEIAAQRPMSLDELSSIHGMGPVKIARYGEGLVAVVRRLASAASSGAGGAD